MCISGMYAALLCVLYVDVCVLHVFSVCVGILCLCARESIMSTFSVRWSLITEGACCVHRLCAKVFTLTLAPPSLQQHLQVSNGETNLAVQKCQRYYDMQEKAQGYAMVRVL